MQESWRTEKGGQTQKRNLESRSGGWVPKGGVVLK